MSCIIDDKINKLTLNETPILERDLIEDKMGILDVKASIDGEVSIDLEMQVANQDDIEKRIMYYWSKLYISNIKKRTEIWEVKKDNSNISSKL